MVSRPGLKGGHVSAAHNRIDFGTMALVCISGVTEQPSQYVLRFTRDDLFDTPPNSRGDFEKNCGVSYMKSNARAQPVYRTS